MAEKTQNANALPVTLSKSPIGSPESRAAARALSGHERFPVIIRQFVSARARDKDGLPIGPPICRSNTARVYGKIFVR
jgi:hypothetical protein